MPTDIKLDEGDGNHVVIEGTVVRTTASDLILDAPDRRIAGGLRRALVHDGTDGLTINFNGDYPGGVTVGGKMTVSGGMTVTGDVRWKSESGNQQSLSEVIETIEDIIRNLNQNLDMERLERFENGLNSLAALLDAATVPPWRTLEEVQNGDDMGALYQSAEDLGFHVEYDLIQYGPDGYQQKEVVKINPPPGTILRRGSTVEVSIACPDGG
ncbi:PASTA domain-containing protein [Brevibacillus porteri]|uniref:PASTA domain-containing protein n=1 Tax=Brevibacillus porteri TaxID=2126350 RepID=UPI003D1A0423